jgi:hypothetical protein
MSVGLVMVHFQCSERIGGLRRRALLAGMVACCAPLRSKAVSGSGDVTAAGQRLTRLLNDMNVDGLWLAGYPIEWRTGQIIGPAETTPGGHTHCSAFAAAVAERLGIYILRPPEHGQMWLANAQEQWLSGADGGQLSARAAGWSRIGYLRDPGASDRAVGAANSGHLVVASYFQPPVDGRQRSGHIAIIRPSDKPLDRIRENGPDVTQAGGRNWLRVAMREGFASHRAGWNEGTIEYF